MVQPEALFRAGKARRNQVRQNARPPVAREKFGVVILAAVQFAHLRHNFLRPQGHVRGQPVGEDLPQFMRQAQDHIAGPGGPGFGRGLQQRFYFAVGRRRNNRRHQHGNRRARLRQGANHPQPPRGACRARLQLAGQVRVQRSDGDRRFHQIVLRHVGDDVQVALYQRGLGDERNGVAGFGQNLQHRAGDLEFFFGGLIGVGDNAQRQRAGGMPAPPQILAQPPRRVALGENLRLKIQSRRKPQIRMRRARKAVDAAVLASAIGVGRQCVRNVRRFVFGHHAFRQIPVDDRLRRAGRRVGVRVGRKTLQVVKRGPRQGFKAPQRRANRPAPLERSGPRRGGFRQCFGGRHGRNYSAKRRVPSRLPNGDSQPPGALTKPPPPRPRPAAGGNL